MEYLTTLSVDILQLMNENLGNIGLATVDKSTDFSYVKDPARIAIYDDLLSSPRIVDIQPAYTKEFIGSLSSEIYNQSKQIGGAIPYTIILQVTENFIHARFSEMVISIFDQGNTIRFSDQGPGISDIDKAQQPGYSSATKEMKQYINGVGSGLPIVKEYLETKHGIINIEDNLNSGAVVTISLISDGNSPYITNTRNQNNEYSSNITNRIDIDDSLKTNDSQFNKVIISSMLSEKGKVILDLFRTSDVLGVTDIKNATGYANSTIHSEFKKLEEAGLIEFFGRKRTLTELGKIYIS